MVDCGNRQPGVSRAVKTRAKGRPPVRWAFPRALFKSPRATGYPLQAREIDAFFVSDLGCWGGSQPLSTASWAAASAPRLATDAASSKCQAVFLSRGKHFYLADGKQFFPGTVSTFSYSAA